MLNLLISILGDKYDLFMVEKKVYDMKEKIQFSLEIQTTLFWKKTYNQGKYLYILTKTFDNDDDDANEDWQGKIMYLEKRQERKIEELNQKSNEIKNIVEQKISGVEEKMDTRMNALEQKISGVEQKMDAKMNYLEADVKEILKILKGGN